MMKGKIKKAIMIIMASIILIGADQVKFNVAIDEAKAKGIVFSVELI